jgi:quinol monooxygenase YgiN
MTDQIVLVAESDIVPGKADALKVLFGKLSDHVLQTEPDLRTYLCHFSEDNTECRTIEHYNNSEAVFFHLENYAPFTEALDKCRKLKKLTVYGNPSEKLRKGLSQMNADIFLYQCGMVR